MSPQVAALDAKVVREINTRYKVVRELQRKHVHGIVEFGKWLVQKKAKVGRGQWGQLFTSKAQERPLSRSEPAARHNPRASQRASQFQGTSSVRRYQLPPR